MSITVPEQRPVLRCLGPASVSVSASPDAQPSVLLPFGKPLALLTYLVLAPDRSATRERLADLLWGDQDRTAGRQSVRRALSFVRTHIGPWVISADEQLCTVSENLDADIKSFSSLIEAGRFEDALQLYRGDFLTGFASPGSREFEMWAEVERAYFRSKAVRAAEILCRTALDSGRFTLAKCAAARVRAIDPNAQLGWRLLLEALAAAGDRVGAITESAKFEAWLASEALEPEPASQSAITHARRAATPSHAEVVPTTPPTPDLVGREPEFGSILESWRLVATGRMQVVAVLGGPGVGKTRLLESVAQRLLSMRKRAIVLRAYPGERSITGAFAGTLAYEIAKLPGASGVGLSVVRHLVALDPRLADQFPALAKTDTGVSTLAARAMALRELITAVCDDAPVALLLDDVHWLDDESRQVLGAVVARLADAPLMIVLASRDAVVLPPLPESHSVIALSPLSVEEVGALISSLGALPADAEWAHFLVARVTAASRGIPLLVLGAIEELIRQGVLQLTDGNWRSPDEARLRERLRSINAVASRLRTLSAGASKLLLACSIAGRPLSRDMLAALATEIADFDAVLELERAGHLKRVGASNEVSHDVIGETALQIANAEDRERAQQALGTVLVSARDEVLVEHGIRHLAALGSFDLLREPVERIARTRIAHSGLSTRDFIARLTGLPPNHEIVARLRRALPAPVRWRRWRPAFAAATATLVLGTTAFVAAERWRDRANQPGLEFVTHLGAQMASRGSVSLDASTWTVRSPLTVMFDKPTLDTLRRALRGTWWVPGERAWAVEIETDTGGADVAEVVAGGERRWLAETHADETAGAWSPDGHYFALVTSAFAKAPGQSIAITDVRSRITRAVGEREIGPEELAWSPDGTRIAFVSRVQGGKGRRVCTIGVDGLGKSCSHGFPSGTRIDGWLNESKLIVQLGSPGPLDAFDVSAGQLTPIDVTGDVSSDLSPDGDWIYFTRLNGDQLEAYVAPAARPVDARRVATAPRGLPAASTSLYWAGQFGRREFLDSIEITAASDTIAVGTEFHLESRGVSNMGHELPVFAARWISSDSSIATVDSVGQLYAKRSGLVDILLSAGGWRATHRQFVIRRDTPVVVMHEDWRDPFTSRWVPFGVPLPRIVNDSVLGNAFLNNGDGWYFSGAYLARPLDARHGLSIEATIRTPITRPIERYLEIAVFPIRGIAQLRSAWDHRTGYFPYRFTTGGHCDFSYPAGEGPQSERAASGVGPLTRYAHGRVVLASGAPARLRLQIFPDGSCGVALEGERPLIRDKILASLDSIIVLIQGNSVGTRLLVGPLVITQGVPTGIDWLHGTRQAVSVATTPWEP